MSRPHSVGGRGPHSEQGGLVRADKSGDPLTCPPSSPKLLQAAPNLGARSGELMSETHVEDSRDPDSDDGEQTPTAVDIPDEEGDAGVGDVELEAFVYGED